MASPSIMTEVGAQREDEDINGPPRKSCSLQKFGLAPLTSSEPRVDLRSSTVRRTVGDVRVVGRTHRGHPTQQAVKEGSDEQESVTSWHPRRKLGRDEEDDISECE